ncbi:YaaR family protein [Thermosediminibacter oceani]|uniref:DUF327 domain-containing protein n=1 Tax=Thermosediminibacter oceani (strain ATCC BAA-1034 / DSM 16646 / JW/IW-1228P) TaxID=555079 RepID=D9RYY2_THEOJ|nr:YaaR family protein [Thermosediminibacter oceani]ADL06810.1 protein of unknown function DUF327 [Thermosediminibacter oceani DSM 16646]
MIKVRGLSSEEVSTASGYVSHRAASGGSRFQEILRSAREVCAKEQLEGMLASIEEQGRRLVKTMSLADLKKYREMLARFLRQCVESGLDLKEERFFTRYGRQKVLTAVKIVDRKLMELAELILSKSDAVKVLAIVDEIRGLLLDLYA